MHYVLTPLASRGSPISAVATALPRSLSGRCRRDETLLEHKRWLSLGSTSAHKETEAGICYVSRVREEDRRRMQCALGCELLSFIQDSVEIKRANVNGIGRTSVIFLAFSD
jgi:hypothetical protein